MTRELTADEVEFTLYVEPEDVPYVGNCMASGDDDVDREAEELIREQLDSGNEWAWCQVRVDADWEGFTGSAFLGGCSYKSPEDFKQPGGYYEDMMAEALDALNTAVSKAAAVLSKLAQ